MRLPSLEAGGGAPPDMSIGDHLATSDDIRSRVGGGAIGFGVLAIASPRSFLALYGMSDEPDVRLMTRVWGSRTTVVEALSLLVRNPQDRRTLMTAAVVNEGVDTLLIATSQAPMRARVLDAATTAAFAAATAYALTD